MPYIPDLPFDAYDLGSVQRWMGPSPRYPGGRMTRKFNSSPLSIHRYFNPDGPDFFKVILYNSWIVGSPGLTSPHKIWASASGFPTQTTLRYLQALTKVSWRYSRRRGTIEVSWGNTTMYVGPRDAVHIERVAGLMSPVYNLVQVVRNEDLNFNRVRDLQAV